MNRRILSVVITKNRPRVFAACIESFFRCALSLDLPFSSLIVVNDSDSISQYAEYDAVLSAVDTGASSLELLHVSKYSSVLSGSEGHVVESLQTLGSSIWCPSRARNRALDVIRTIASQDDIVLFFDDDIIFDCGTYHGIHYRSAGRTILQESVRVLEDDDWAVVGCRYKGRADVSLAEHLAHYARQLLASETMGDGSERARRLTEQLLGYPELPLVVHEDETMHETYQGPGGLSLGFLALNAQMLPAIRFPNIYNEDWFWIEALVRRGAKCVQLSHALLHAPDTCYGFTAERALSQEIGDVIWDTLRISETDQIEERCRRDALMSQTTLDRISAVKERKVRNLEAAIQDIQEIQQSYELRQKRCDTGISFIPEALLCLRADVILLKRSLEQCALPFLVGLLSKALQYQEFASGASALLNASSSDWDSAGRQAEWGENQRMVSFVGNRKREAPNGRSGCIFTVGRV